MTSDCETEHDVLEITEKTPEGNTQAKSKTLSPLEQLEIFETGKSQPVQSSSPVPKFTSQLYKDNLLEEVDTKDTEDQLQLIGEQLSSIFPKQWESSGCDNTTIESSSINDVSAFNDTVTHNCQKKSM